MRNLGPSLIKVGQINSHTKVILGASGTRYVRLIIGGEWEGVVIPHAVVPCTQRQYIPPFFVWHA